ncbi:Cephalosporin hydroxylase [Terricaulis silvestris]|uniref:Cephalosporin hydroxylase n=2 Tax=Terricaulis silvestris TaxID=2686094 RepID=A0A6I6MSX6_9CAUL|nr:Cephalosporin hydroxylase [Terricaulis silvestris]
MTAHGLRARVVSVDLSPPADLSDARIQFVAGDAHDLSAALTHDLLASLPHPWLVSEDSAHTFEACTAVLRFFDNHLVVGDYIVIEDGVLSDMAERHYETYEHGPNRAVERFLSEHVDTYEIDGALCDFFGQNVTWNPNAWLRRAR